MGTNTPELQLYKPDVNENVDVAEQLNENYDKLDAAVAALRARVFDVPICQAKQGVSQSIPFQAWTALTFDLEDVDLDSNIHSTVTNTSRFTAPIDGIYQCSGKVSWTPNINGWRFSRWQKNGATIVDASGTNVQALTAGTSHQGTPATTILIPLVAGDYVELYVWQNGNNPNLTTQITNEERSYASMVWWRPST
jgi:hypothetical protein